MRVVWEVDVGGAQLPMLLQFGLWAQSPRSMLRSSNKLVICVDCAHTRTAGTYKYSLACTPQRQGH